MPDAEEQGVSLVVVEASDLSSIFVNYQTNDRQSLFRKSTIRIEIKVD